MHDMVKVGDYIRAAYMANTDADSASWEGTVLAVNETAVKIDSYPHAVILVWRNLTFIEIDGD